MKKLSNKVLSEIEHSSGEELWAKLNLADMAHWKTLKTSRSLKNKDLILSKKALQRLKSLSYSKMTAHEGDLFDLRKQWMKENNFPTGWLSMGRARREAVTLAFHLKLREKFISLQMSLSDLVLKINRLAEIHAETIFPDYTYLLPSQPTTFGHYISTFTGPLLRQLDRGAELSRRLNEAPMGGASTNGSSFSFNRESMAKLLGFEKPVAHTRDAVWRSDLIYEVSSYLAQISLTMARMANDLLVLSTKDFGLISFNEGLTRKSQILPQKNNPYHLAMLRGMCADLASEPYSTYLLNLTPTNQPDNRVYSHFNTLQALDKAIRILEVSQIVMSGLKLDTQKAKSKCEEPSLFATDLAEFLSLKGMDYEVASKAIRTALDDKNFLEKVLKIATEHKIKTTLKELKKVSTARQSIFSKKQSGSSHPEQLKFLLRKNKEKVERGLKLTIRLQKEIQKKELSLFREF